MCNVDVCIHDREVKAHQTIGSDVPLLACAFILFAFCLKTKALHLLVCHELDRAVAHAHKREYRATVEPCNTFGTVDRRKSIYDTTFQQGNKMAMESSRQRFRYALGASGFVVNMRTLTTHIGLVIMAVTAPGCMRLQ